uniref:Cnidarian restricted protein n=1 Tax=Clytia hemisphaerica TaxID=252671 RepID=A0A7M6DNH9_9CNID
MRKVLQQISVLLIVGYCMPFRCLNAMSNTGNVGGLKTTTTTTTIDPGSSVDELCKKQPEFCKKLKMLAAMQKSKKHLLSSSILDAIKNKTKSMQPVTTMSPSIMQKANVVKTKLKKSMRLMRLKSLGSKLVIT